MMTILVSVGVAILAGWVSNTNLSKRLDDIIRRLDRMDNKFG